MPKPIVSLLLLCILTTVCFCLLLLSTNSTPTGHLPKTIKKRTLNRVRTENGEFGPWPFPKEFKSYDDCLNVRREVFKFKISEKVSSSVQQCDILRAAINRYNRLIFKDYRPFEANIYDDLDKLEIQVEGICEKWPHADMDESYTLELLDDKRLSSKTIWGALRGLETFSQLVYHRDGYLVVNKTQIEDGPRFKYRGLMVDTARHFIPVPYLLRNLDAMSYNKLNVLHWHIVDDQSFPYESTAYPNLSYYGAYDPHTQVYTQADVRTVVEYARLRGIRVIPEFDTPGHALAWGKGTKNIVIDCSKLMTEDPSQPPKGFGVLNVQSPSTYKFLEKLFLEVSQAFPDEFLHLGGDEVATDCWPSGSTTLYQEHIDKMESIVKSLHKKYILWQDVFDNGLTLPRDAIIQVWKSWGSPEEIVSSLLQSGYQVIVSHPWYLDMISYKKDWIGYYEYEPLLYESNRNKHQSKLLIGGEACIWAEYVDETNFLSRTWPRASAVAERLWSDRNLRSANLATNRFESHRCLLKQRGIPAHPINGPSHCPTLINLQSNDDQSYPMERILFRANVQTVMLSVDSTLYLLTGLFLTLVLFVYYYFFYGKRRKRFHSFSEEDSSHK